MKYAYIKGDTVVDIVDVDPKGIFRPDYAALFCEAPDQVELGWIRNEGGEFSPPPAVTVVPQEIMPLQGLLALDKFGLSVAYEAWANSADRTFAERVFINRAQTWRRNDPTLLAAAVAFSLTPVQLDELFIEGSKL